ncbi:MAG: hypothetical protein H6607_10295 [Flavobacteriales bacterium]|nr:hypothetical protein [Flavobacteriales bacterium]
MNKNELFSELIWVLGIFILCIGVVFTVNIPTSYQLHDTYIVLTKSTLVGYGFIVATFFVFLIKSALKLFRGVEQNIILILFFILFLARFEFILDFVSGFFPLSKPSSGGWTMYPPLDASEQLYSPEPYHQTGVVFYIKLVSYLGLAILSFYTGRQTK